jgi:phosphoglycolate phosphatase-like HAD superfamily hydrolase
MKVINAEDVVLWDTDDTIAIWNSKHNIPHEGAVPIVNPYSKETVYLRPHKVHIRIMKEYKGRGFTNIVASAGGVKWAEAVIKAFGLEEYVDFVMTKPNRHFDDKEDKESIIGVRLYFEDKT